jgi:hypothetical protein
MSRVGVNDRLLDGAHRVACALALRLPEIWQIEDPREARRTVRARDVVIPRSVATSLSACQNGSSRLTLVWCPNSMTVRLRTGDGIIRALCRSCSFMIDRAPNSP